jgi:hypothetical protein
VSAEPRFDGEAFARYLYGDGFTTFGALPVGARFTFPGAEPWTAGTKTGAGRYRAIAFQGGPVRTWETGARTAVRRIE